MHGGDETVLASTVWKCKFDFLLCILSFFYLLYQPKCGHVKMLKQFSLFFICLVNFLFDELLKANGEEKIGVGEFLNYVMLSDDLIHFWSFRWLLSELSKFLWNLNLNEMKKFRLKFYLNYEIFWIFPTVFVIVKYLKFWFALNHCVIVQILSKIKVLSLPFFDEAESFLMSRIKSFSWFVRSQCTVKTQDAALFLKKKLSSNRHNPTFYDKIEVTSHMSLEPNMTSLTKPTSPFREKSSQHNNKIFLSFVLSALFAHIKLLINSASPKTNEIGHELGIIKSNFVREISALKSAVSDFGEKHQRHRSSSFASSSFASSSSIRKVPSESIKSPTKWNEKTTEIPFDDKFSTIIDDGRESRDERSDKRSRLMMKQEINNASSRHYSDSIDDANESSEDASVYLVPQDESI